MSRNWIALGVGVVAGALLAGGGTAAEEPKKDDKAPAKVSKEKVKEMMIAAHRGEKSPLVRTKAELKKDAPDWDQLAKDAKVFAEMGEVLKTGASPYTNPKGYIEAGAALGKAVGEKDAKASGEAVGKLGTSCGACHYGVPK